MTYQENYKELDEKFKALGLEPTPGAGLFADVVHIMVEIHRFYQAEMDVLQRNAIKHGREIEAMKDFVKRAGDENNAKLMAIFYSLDTLKTCGTHHEKRVVLTHLMASIDRMLNKGSYGLSYKNDDLPF